MFVNLVADNKKLKVLFIYKLINKTSVYIIK